MAKLPSDEEIDAATISLETYFSALGKVAHEWNHMQEELGKLFCQVAGLSQSTGMAIWHSSKSDLAQRHMLRAAAEERGADEAWCDRHPHAKTADIENLVKNINTFSENRNAAIHAPCNPVLGGDDIEIIAVAWSGNPNAKKLNEGVVLRGADILAHFEWFQRIEETYRRYAKDLEYALSEPRVPWPGKPHMPTLGEKNDPRATQPHPE